MKPHFEVFTVRETETKPVWTRLGVAFRNKSGGINVMLEGLPTQADGQYKLVLLPPKAKDNEDE